MPFLGPHLVSPYRVAPGQLVPQSLPGLRNVSGCLRPPGTLDDSAGPQSPGKEP